jgi:hypothetical protein
MANAGVVGMAEVVSPSSTTGATAGMSVPMWSYIWVGAAAFVLLFLHLAMMGRGR